MDYYAVGKLDEADAKAFLTSVRKACEEAECALIGGETAEMPGVYKPGHFDCAGFAVGVVDESRQWGAHNVRAGDLVIGVPSSGFHSNGYSLLRKVFAEDMDHWADTLLQPTHLYVRLAKALQAEELVHAVAHVTGGGMENLPRVMPPGTFLNLQTWKLPAGFAEVLRRTGMTAVDLLQILNCGVGLALFVPPVNRERVLEIVKTNGFEAGLHLGEVMPAEDSSADASVDYGQWRNQ